MSTSNVNKPGAKRRASSKLSLMLGGSKRKQAPAAKDLISTANKPETEDIFSDLESAVDESILRSPQRYPDEIGESSNTPSSYEFEPNRPVDTTEESATGETKMDVDVRSAVVFVRPPALNQIGPLADNVRDIQTAINTIKLYMDALQNNTAMSTKKYFTMLEEQTNKLAYKDIMFSILNNNSVNKRNFHAVSNMFYYYYVKLFDNTVPIAHVIVNVNYTRGKTNITHALTAFFNSCAHYVVSNIKQLFNVEHQLVNIPDEYYKIIDANQIALTNLYNFRLNDLRSVVFIKHTPDNDVNVYESVRANNPEERVFNVPIRVMINVPRLYFE